MRATALGLLGLLVVLADSAYAFEDKVEQISRSFEITYPNKQKEIVVVEWTAVVTTNFERHGSASKWDHPIDDRSCTWASTGVVSRQAFFVSASGVKAPITDSLKVFGEVNPGRVGPKNLFQAAGGYHKTCGDVMGKIEADHRGAMNSMKGSVQQVVEQDAKDAESNLMALLKPIKIQARASVARLD